MKYYTISSYVSPYSKILRCDVNYKKHFLGYNYLSHKISKERYQYMNPCLLWAGYNARRTISAKQLEAASNLRPHPNSIGWRLKLYIKSTHMRYICDMIVLLDNWHILPLPTCYLWCSSSTCDNERMCYELTYLFTKIYILGNFRSAL